MPVRGRSRRRRRRGVQGVTLPYPEPCVFLTRAAPPPLLPFPPPSAARQTGGAAFMREGPNLLKLARKEQCMALLSQLRTKFKLDGRVYRVFPSGEVQYLHPKDGVYPEKVNKGRVGVNNNPRSIGKNVDPAKARPQRSNLAAEPRPAADFRPPCAAHRSSSAASWGPSRFEAREPLDASGAPSRVYGHRCPDGGNMHAS